MWGGDRRIARRKLFEKLTILFVLIFCVSLVGCNQPAAPQGGEPSAPQKTPEVDVIITPPAEGPDESTAPAVGQIAMVYIGTKVNGFTDYPIVYDGDLTAEKLIQGIADLTGWDLTLAEEVTRRQRWHECMPVQRISPIH